MIDWYLIGWIIAWAISLSFSCAFGFYVGRYTNLDIEGNEIVDERPIDGADLETSDRGEK